MNKLDSRLYKATPLRVENGIPVFTNADAYIANYDRIAHDHLAAMRSHGINPFIEEDIWRALEETTLTLIRRYGNAGMRVLDVGVGLARLLREVPEMHRYGVDISLDYLSEARTAGVEVALARAEALPYHDGVFDLVVCTDVLEHVLDLNAAVAEVLRVLKPEGHLIARVPDREDLSPYLAPDYPYAFAHLRRFDAAELTLLFSRVFEYDVVDIHPVFVFDDRKLRWPLRRGRTKMTVFLRHLSRLSARLRRVVLQGLYLPLELNVVVHKSSPGSDARVKAVPVPH